MKESQFQRFISLHAKKYGLLVKNKVFKRTENGNPKFFVRSDKITLIELAMMYKDFKVYASNSLSEATWKELITGLRRITTPSINVSGVSHRSHEQEFLIWVDKLSSFVIPVNKSTPLAKINFDSLEEIRRSVVSSAIMKYNFLSREFREFILPRSLAGVILYHISKGLYLSFLKVCIKTELSEPVSLDSIAAEVMLSTPTLQKVKQKLEGV